MGRRIAVVIHEQQMLAGGQSPQPSQEKSSPEHNGSATTEYHQQSHALTVAIISLTNEYRASNKDHQREQQKNNRWVKAGTIFVFLYTLITFYQLRATWDALDHTMRNSRLDQRAWVGPKIAELPPEIKAGISLKFGVEQINTGKTPAVNVRGITRGRSVLEGSAVVPYYPPMVKGGSIGIIQPGAVTHQFTVPVVMTPEQVDALETGEYIFYWYGEISYEDIFGGIHCTTYCFFLEPGLKSSSQCLGYNEIRDTKCENTN